MKAALTSPLKPKKSFSARAKKPICVSETGVTKDDVARLTEVARLLLEQLERAIRQRTPRTAAAEKAEQKQKQYALMFGQKQSYVDTLVTLSDLLMKLQPPQTSGGEMTPTHDIAISAADTALIEAFIERMKNRGEAETA